MIFMQEEMFQFPLVLCLQLIDGNVSSLVWSNRILSNREMKKLTKKFKNHPAVLSMMMIPYWKIYETEQHMKDDIPEHKKKDNIFSRLTFYRH